MQHKVLNYGDLKADQVAGAETILAFVNDPNASELMVEGPAGSGKTSMIKSAIGELPREERNGVVICAPTNKAVKVAKELSGGAIETTTIFKLLGVSPQANGEVKELRQGDNIHERLMATSLVALDEASMVSSGLRPFIHNAQEDYGIKFVYIGDRYQLPPVGEELSWTFRTDKRVALTEIKRHDNAIINLATQLRGLIDNPSGRLKIKDEFNDTEGGVELFSRSRGFEERILDTWGALNETQDRDFSSHRIISWRNTRVEGYNDLVREQIYGRSDARSSALLVGERVVVCNPVQSLQDDTVTLMNTDEEGFVEKINVCMHPKYDEVECYQLVLLRESTNTLVGCFTPTQRGWKVVDRMLNQFRIKAQNEDKIYWGAFWKLKELMNDVRPCHALTTHRAQGSTFRETFVDLDDLLSNREKLEGLKAAYTAVTRASFKVNVKWSGF